MSTKIGLIGYGRMGKEVEAAALQQDLQVAAKFDLAHPLDSSEIGQIDVLIDFSSADAVLTNVKIATQASKPLVIGATGWLDHLQEVRRLVESSDTGLIYASNFSLGMNLFFRIAAHAAEIFERFDQYDPFIHEWHHRGKADSPSGTALTLGEILLKTLKRKKSLATQSLAKAISREQLHVSSTRAGNIPGTHLVGFDSEADTIELKHTARNRRGFAVGALLAAEWIVGKRGLFTMDDLLSDQLKLSEG